MGNAGPPLQQLQHLTQLYLHDYTVVTEGDGGLGFSF